jgi:hypothetical protein
MDIGWWGDASTSFGIGIIIGQFWAIWQWAPGFRVGPKQAFDIGWAEAITVESGLCLALHLGLLNVTNDHGHLFLVRSDNAGVIAVTNKGCSCSEAINSILKQIFTLQACNGIHIHTEYIPSHENIADALSRGDIAAFLAGFPGASQKVSFPLPSHLLGKLISL